MLALTLACLAFVASLLSSLHAFGGERTKAFDLSDGTTVVGQVIAEGEVFYVLRTSNGSTVRVPIDQIRRVRILDADGTDEPQAREPRAGQETSGQEISSPDLPVESDRSLPDPLQPSPNVGSMVKVPAGPFWMGCHPSNRACTPYETPGREVTLRTFWIDRTEVTVDAYAECVAAEACKKPDSDDSRDNWGKAGRGSHPANSVSWTDAKTYCEWQGRRLPTEAEWEKAARGGDGRVYPWGNSPPTCSRAQYSGCDGDTVPVGSNPSGAAPSGAMNMVGNVGEWVADWINIDYYSEGPDVDPRGPPSGSTRGVRGGSFLYESADITVLGRGGYAPGYRKDWVGFRCAW